MIEKKAKIKAIVEGYTQSKETGEWYQRLMEPYDPFKVRVKDWIAAKEKEVGSKVNVLNICYWNLYFNKPIHIEYEVLCKTKDN